MSDACPAFRDLGMVDFLLVTLKFVSGAGNTETGGRNR